MASALKPHRRTFLSKEDALVVPPTVPEDVGGVSCIIFTLIIRPRKRVVTFDLLFNRFTRKKCLVFLNWRTFPSSWAHTGHGACQSSLCADLTARPKWGWGKVKLKERPESDCAEANGDSLAAKR